MYLSILNSSFDYYAWIVLPFLIFISRLCDVTLNTLRHVFMTKGYKKIVPFLGFFEVLIWIIVVGQVMKNLNNIACYIAWASGFATGTYVGLLVEERLALGLQVLRIITNQDCTTLIDALRNNNHGVTIVDGHGAKGPVKLLYAVVKRKDMTSLAKLIEEHNPGAFYSVEDVKSTNQGIFSKKDDYRSFLK